MVDLRPTEEQRRLVDGVADVLRERFPTTRYARLSRRELPDHWKLVAELGWLGLGVPAERDGAGLNVAEQALVNREFGRFLLPVSVLATGHAAAVAADRAQWELCGGLMSGRARCALAIPFGAARVTPDEVAGSFQLVDPEGAAHVLVVGSSVLAVVESQSLKLKPVQAVDETISLARANCESLPPLASATSPGLLAALRLLLTAQLVGIAEVATARAAEYAKTRHQFGKPIGSFQAVAHLCADNAVRAEAAFCQLVFAAIALRDGRTDASFQLDAAQLVATDAAVTNATDNIQVHGGMGFSAECDAHHFLKRALLLRQLADSLAEPARGMLEAPSPYTSTQNDPHSQTQ